MANTRDDDDDDDDCAGDIFVGLKAPAERRRKGESDTAIDSFIFGVTMVDCALCFVIQQRIET